MSKILSNFCTDPQIDNYRDLETHLKNKDSFFYKICNQLFINSLSDKIPQDIRREKKQVASKFLLYTDTLPDNSIKTLTINFASSQTSIFEFQERIFDPSIQDLDIKHLISRNMKNYLQRYEILRGNGSVNDVFYEILSSVDQDYGNDKRYSISFNPDIDIDKYISLNDTDAYALYRQDWCQFYNANFANIAKDTNGLTMNQFFINKINNNLKKKLNKTLNINQQTICDTVSLFDFLVLKSFIDAVNMLNIKNYKKIIQDMHKEVRDNNQNKSRTLVSYIRRYNISIVFLQELQDDTVSSLNTELENTDYQLLYRKTNSNMSGIIIKKGLNPVVSVPDQLSDTSLNETIFVYIERYNMFLISTHLNSKSKKDVNKDATIPYNSKNYDDQWKVLNDYIESLLTSHPEVIIILGGDLNHHPEGSRDIFPSDNKVKTTMKQRTSMQAQPKKIDIVDKKTADHIMVRNGTINKGNIVLINEGYNIDPDTVMLPSPKYHISDHYGVFASISF